MPAAVLLCALLGWLASVAGAEAQVELRAPSLAKPRSAGELLAFDRRPMDVFVVTHAGPCAPDCPRWIAAQGEITSGTPDRFRAILDRIGGETLPVVVDSIGGSVPAAMEIGRMLRRRGHDVVVGRTAVFECTAGDAACRAARARGEVRGRIQTLWSICISACPLILAGGVHRYVGATATVGVHELRQEFTSRIVQRTFRTEKPGLFAPAEQKLVSEKVVGTHRTGRPAPEEFYTRVSDYLEEMGLSAKLVRLMKSKPHQDILILTAAQVRQTALATEQATANDVLRGLVGLRPVTLPRLMSCTPEGRCLPDLPTLPAPTGRGRVLSAGLTIVF